MTNRRLFVACPVVHEATEIAAISISQSGKVRGAHNEPMVVIERSDEILDGAPVFAGTRVPVQTLLDYLAAGDRLDDFLRDFPTVSREQATAALRLMGELVAAAG